MGGFGLDLGIISGLGVVVALAAAAVAVSRLAGKEDPPPSAELLGLRTLHWCVTVVAIGYPLIFSADLDLAFLTAWVGVLATWAASDNACVLSLVEADRTAGGGDASMRELPLPWPAFAVLLFVAVRYVVGSALPCEERVLLVGAFATYVGAHAMIKKKGGSAPLRPPVASSHRSQT